MWQVLYGDAIIYDPRDPTRLALDMKGEVALNEAGSFTFTLPPTHPLCNKISLMQKDEEIKVLRDGDVEFCGRAIKAEQKFTGAVTYTCEGERAYLNDVTLPAYSNKQGGNAPSSVDGLFNWYITQYNLKVPESHRFIVGVNEGAKLDKNNVIFRENSSRQNVWAEIKEKLVDKLGGWVYVEHRQGVRYINYLADGGKTCAQKIELGINLLDFTREKDHTKIFTKLIPIGKTQGEHDEGELTIESIPDGMVGIACEKRGDALYDLKGIETFGIIEQVKEFSDITTPARLVDAGIAYMASAKVADTLELTAVDLHLIDPSIEKIALGSYIRAHSVPHGLDEYFLCTKKPFVVGDPKGCKYVLGNQHDTLTSQQTDRIKELNATVGKAGEVVTDKTRQAAQTATNYLITQGESVVFADATKQELGSNVSVSPNAVDIRKGTDTLATFTPDKIALTPKRTAEVSITYGQMKLNGQTLSAYVIAEGDSNGWHYRKYSSGWSEATKTIRLDASARVQDWGSNQFIDAGTHYYPYPITGDIHSSATYSVGRHLGSASFNFVYADRCNVFAWVPARYAGDKPNSWITIRIEGRWK